MSRHDVPAVVLGAGITALGALRALTQVGVRTLMHESDALLRRSRYFNALPGDRAPELEARLAASGLDRAVLIPCSDEWTQAVARLPQPLAERFPASVPRPEALVRLIDKNAFNDLLVELDIDRPWSMNVDDPSQLRDVDDSVFVDAFLKPRNSQSFFRRFGVKAFRTRTRREAEMKLEDCRVAGETMILQRYVAGPSDQHYFIDGFVGRDGAVRAFFARRRLRMYPPDFGNSSAMVTVPLNVVEGGTESLRRIFDHLGYRGIFSAEFKRDATDGVLRILEVNARAWWYVEFAARCGVNTCEMAYRDALGLEVATVTDYPVGRTMVYPYHDFFACLDLRRRGQMRTREWIWAWATSAQPVFRPDDPWPSLAGAAEVLLARVRRRVSS